MSSIKFHGVALLALSALLIGGCGLLKKKQPEPAPSASQVALVPPPPAPVPAAPAEPEVTVADEAIAAPEDFEDEAFEKVSDKTYKSELDSLRKDIEAK